MYLIDLITVFNEIKSIKGMTTFLKCIELV